MPRYAPIGKKKQYARRSRKGQRQGAAMTRQAIRSQRFEDKYFGPPLEGRGRVSPRTLLTLRGARNYEESDHLGDVLKAALNPIASVKIPKSLQKANEAALKLSPGGEGIKKAQELLGTDKELSVAPIDLVGLGAGSMAVKGAARGARAVSRASKARTAAKRAKYNQAVKDITDRQLDPRSSGTVSRAEAKRVQKMAPLRDRTKNYADDVRYSRNLKKRLPRSSRKAKTMARLQTNIGIAEMAARRASDRWSAAKNTSDEVDEAYAKRFFNKRGAVKEAEAARFDYEMGRGRSIRQKVKDAYIGRKHDRYVTKYGNKPKPPSKIRLRRSKTTVRPARVDKTRMEIARQRELEMEDYADQFYAMEARKEKYRELSKQIKQAVKDQDPEKYFAEMRRVLPQVHSGDELDDMLAMLDYEYEQYLAPFFRKMNRDNGPDFGQGPYGDNIVP